MDIHLWPINNRKLIKCPSTTSIFTQILSIASQRCASNEHLNWKLLKICFPSRRDEWLKVILPFARSQCWLRPHKIRTIFRENTTRHLMKWNWLNRAAQFYFRRRNGKQMKAGGSGNCQLSPSRGDTVDYIAIVKFTKRPKLNAIAKFRSIYRPNRSNGP